MPQGSTTEIVDRASRGNWRVFSHRELGALGLSTQQIRTMLGRGQLHRIHPGLYLYGQSELSWQGAFLAAQRMGGDDAYLTWGSGLACHGCGDPTPG